MSLGQPFDSGRARLAPLRHEPVTQASGLADGAVEDASLVSFCFRGGCPQFDGALTWTYEERAEIEK